jgi:hypothetical protein
VKYNFAHIYYAAPDNVKGKKHIYAETIIFLLRQGLCVKAIIVPRLIHCSLERGWERGSFAPFHNLIIPSPLTGEGQGGGDEYIVLSDTYILTFPLFLSGMGGGK